MQPQANRLLQAIDKLSHQINPRQLRALFRNPVFIVSAPRSGSTLLFEALSSTPDFWTIGEESHSIFNALPQLSPARCNYQSGRLTARHADKDTRRLMRCGFLMFLRNAAGQRYLQLPRGTRPDSIRFLEKTPRNTLNIPFLLKVFPDARFIFLHRDPRQNISSIMEAWNVGIKDFSFVTFPNLPGWDRNHWCMLLPPNWQTMNGKTIAEIAAFQWQECNNIALNDLDSLPRSQWAQVSYQQLVDDPAGTVEYLCSFAGVRTSESPNTSAKPRLSLSKTTITPPDPDKWRRHESEILPLMESMELTFSRLKALSAFSRSCG
jgi:hypothetical protein